MAPEVNYLLPTETYDAYKSDIYSLGMCLYVLVFGEFPLKDESEDSTLFDTDTIGGITGLKCSIDCKKKWALISTDLQDLLGSMLSMEPDDRPSLKDILESDWIKEAYYEDMPLYIYEQLEERKTSILAKVKDTK
jgi:serine/threonine protein kinase